GIEQTNAIARRLLPHATRLHLLTRKTGNLHRGLGLPVCLSHCKVPNLLHMLDDFGIQRFAGGADFAKRCLARPHVLLHQHAPYSWRRAERSHLIRSDSPQYITCIEAWLVSDEYRGTSIPRCKKTAIRMLRPTRRRGTEMHVANLKTKPAT